ncbi:MAG: rhodanese-like domain-containing protein [Halobacteriaceae archaeon]
MDGEITQATLRELQDADDVRIVDVRQRDAYATGHLPDSECIPFPDLPNEITRLEGADHVVTVCPHGDASLKAARLIAAYDGLAPDATVQSLAGGLAAWEGPLVSSDDEAEHPL